jgi:hypothetical protein
MASVYERLRHPDPFGGAPCEVEEGIQYLLRHIGSLGDARWDQRLRYEFGDEKAEVTIRWLENNLGIKPDK